MSRFLRAAEAARNCRYPAHDYGRYGLDFAEERAFNLRLQVASRQEYVDLMNNLKLANPKMMDVAVPENQRMGLILSGSARPASMLKG